MPARPPTDFFDADLDAMIRLTFRSNGQNWEKYLRWLNLRYFESFGRFYQPLVEVIHRYNHRERVAWYHQRPQWLTSEQYRDFRAHAPDGARRWNDLLNVNGHSRSFPHGVRVSVALLNQRTSGDGAS